MAGERGLHGDALPLLRRPRQRVRRLRLLGRRRTRFAEYTFFGNVRFERCVFDRSRLRQQTATFDAEFVDCVFIGRVRAMNF
ncbi:hypothetical protein SMD20_08545 [Nonomuraea sp. LP-02]|uniref:hypothetical protein n=1 Tax=Nonomuraea sp. LP-02 TaxID=3097960 RepID=UPI002E2FE7D0|nr:hypothetical protein [Nonomuraea sp. LP-02]MED7924278.1 hypothetical protein [Nonomuraea sp. LP-02]